MCNCAVVLRVGGGMRTTQRLVLMNVRRHRKDKAYSTEQTAVALHFYQYTQTVAEAMSRRVCYQRNTGKGHPNIFTSWRKCNQRLLTACKNGCHQSPPYLYRSNIGQNPPPFQSNIGPNLKVKALSNVRRWLLSILGTSHHPFGIIYVFDVIIIG